MTRVRPNREKSVIVISHGPLLRRGPWLTCLFGTVADSALSMVTDPLIHAPTATPRTDRRRLVGFFCNAVSGTAACAAGVGPLL
jgi:hypothetical protein